MTVACITPSRRLNWIYVLSALCMIFGLFATNGSLDFSPMPAGSILMLIVVLNVYEFMTLGIAWLINRKGIEIDAWTLVVIESLFLFDSAFLTSEIIAISPALGHVMAIVLFSVGLLKLSIILRIAGYNILSRPAGMAVILMMIICIIPSLFKSLSQIHAGKLSQENYYLGWWIASVAPLSASIFWRRNHSALMHAIMGIGLISVVAHIATESWVNRVQFSLANLSPFLLATAVMIGNAKTLPISLRQAISYQLVVPVLAVLLSARSELLLLWNVSEISVTPLRLILLGAVCVYLHGLIRHRDWRFGAGLAGGLACAIAGSNSQSILRNGIAAIRNIYDLVTSLVPRTLIQWGWVSITSAFVLLMSGAMQSLKKSNQHPSAE